jgi:hypothetical protein
MMEVYNFIESFAVNYLWLIGTCIMVVVVFVDDTGTQ